MLTARPGHEIEDLLAKGVQVWNYLRPEQLQIIREAMSPSE